MASSNTPLSPNPVVRPIQQFIRLEAAGGILLLICAVAALVWANSPWSASYFELWQTNMTVGVGSLVISKPILLWINDGLMAVFFFVVGLEIKREVLVGELSSPKKAGLALMAAVGGMIVPAIIYAVINLGGEGVDGWGIPMATDIAFALGILAILGKRAPLALKIFLTALAIVDDLGAVLVIALFYTAKVGVGYLVAAAFVIAALFAGNKLGVRRTAFYTILGIVLWVLFLKSGVHATVAGVLLALTVPASRLIDSGKFLQKAKALLGRFAEDVVPGKVRPSTEQMNVMNELEATTEKLDTPLHRMERSLHGWVAFFIMPLFALANAGVAVDNGIDFTSTVTLGIILGLFVGKQIGVTLFAWIAVKLGWAELPTGISWRQIFGASLLCGIGFTMSLFIGNLAFEQAALLDAAKIGILAGSILSGVCGWIVLTRAKPATPESENV